MKIYTLLLCMLWHHVAGAAPLLEKEGYGYVVAQHALVPAHKLINAFSLKTVSPAYIQKKSKEIEANMKFRSHGRKTLFAAAVALSLYRCYELYEHYKDSAQGPAVPEPLVPPAGISYKPWSSVVWEKLVAGKNALFSVSTWRGIGRVTAEIGVMSVFQHVLKIVERKFITDESLFWFVLHEANFKLAAAEAYSYAQECEKENGECQKYTYESVISASNALVTRVADIAAFMQYKARTMTRKKRCHAEQIARYLSTALHEYTVKARMIISGQRQEQMQALLLHYLHLFDRECAHFARLEGTMWIDTGLLNHMLIPERIAKPEKI